ncbi:hypothetical protein V6N13_084900 [Hibiscus sabdariffa]|uniref:Uncharacterized protein n=1 Tax=Hibiscus sabdariffa TaxID=183260 RepID=A0ABR2CZW9_9ROSI
MGKGRAPCCDKDKVKRGPWSPQEDLILTTFIQKHGHQNWRSLPKQAGLLRCGKSCRLRWINYLRPDVKRGNFSKEEEETIIRLHETLGNKWSKIASHLEGRTDNEIKNVWNTHLKKRVASQNGFKESYMASSSSSSVTFVSSSCGERNIEAELEQQWHEGSVNKKAREAFEEPKALSSSSNSSSNSNVTNISQVDAMPEISDTAFDIPLESDLDFWGTFDSLGSFQHDEILSNGVGGNQSYTKDAESDEWLQYMEIELGLNVTRNENQNNLSNNAAEPLVPEMYDMLPKP